MPISSGQILNNRYRIVKLLGQGGMGAVYHAWDLNMECARALKENLDTSPEAQRQFKREAQILGDLSHPNLPKVIDYFVIPGQGQYLVMEFVEGQDLQEKLLQAKGPLPEAQVLGWIGQVCNALEYLHSQKPPVIHRDIKPANIKITPQGKAMLVDFGIAKIYDSQLRTTIGARAVTPGFSPNEQYLSSGLTDPRTDIYSMGATLYTLLTGKVPTEAPERSLGKTIPAPRSLNPLVSKNVENTILRALEILPQNRFQRMADFENALTMPVVVASNTPRRVTHPVQRITVPKIRQGSWYSMKAIAIVSVVAVVIIALFFMSNLLMNFGFWGNTTVIASEQLIPLILSSTYSPIPPFSTPTITFTPLLPTSTEIVFTLTHTREPSPTTTPTSQIPKITEFFFCDRPCDDANSHRVSKYLEKTKYVYFGFSYQNMVKGTHYSRVWSMDGNEWIRYDCIWEGPEDGEFYLKLWDTMGLHSGTWVVEMIIDNLYKYTGSIDIAGSYDYWDPAGIKQCSDW